MTHVTSQRYAVPVKLSRHSVIVTLAVAASLMVTGCAAGGSPGGGTGGGGSSGGSGGTSSDGTTTETDTETTPGLDGYVGLPDTFPSDVPVIDGEVVFGIDLGTGWSIVVATDDIVAGYTAAADKLTGAGFTSDVSSSTADGSFGSFSSAAFTVQVTATDSADYGTSVQYVVIKNG